MGDEDDRTEFITQNSKVLSKSTTVGAEFILGLLENGLIDQEEMELLSTPGMPNIQKSMIVYTKISNRWNQSQFEMFKQVLLETGNLLALQVFTNAGAEFFLTNYQVQLLRQQKEKSENGCYEGLSLEEETSANKIVHYARNDQIFKDGKFHLSSDLRRREFLRLVRQFEESLNNQTVWWNPRKPPLPANYIGRSVARTHLFRPDGTLPTSVQSKSLLEVNEDLVLMIDPPGMGKSSEVTNHEKQLRINFNRNRIVLRANLNEIQPALSTICEIETAPILVHILAPFLPTNTVLIPKVRFLLLLDGLDEVCPKYQETMVTLLRTLKSSDDFRELRVLVTARPHLREAIEEEFNLKSWSLLPLTEGQQDEYMSAMGVPNENFLRIRSTLTRSIAELLNNPLILSMLVDVLKSGGSLSAADVNIYDLYTQFVEAKHDLHCVEKLRMEAGANFTHIVKESLLKKNLPFYYHAACSQLGINNRLYLPVYTELVRTIAKEPPSTASDSLLTMELLSYGLLIKDQKNRLAFKHRSFAEYFYARLLLREQESIPQVVTDTLFGCIYAHSLKNVEAFVEAALSKKLEGTSPINVTIMWMLRERSFDRRRNMLRQFVTGKLFLKSASVVIRAFTEGRLEDLWDAFKILVDSHSQKSFSKLFEWMSHNREWSRRELFKINGNRMASRYPPPAARLMVAIAVNFVGQELLSAEEESVAIMSPENRLIYTVASCQINENKWDFVARHLKEGQLRELMLDIDDEDFNRVINDRDSAWRLVENLSEEEIYSLVTCEQTRVTDVVGRSPKQACVALGRSFLSGLADFRTKFGDDEGKTVFDLSEFGCGFTFDLLWEDLLKEKQRNISDGAVKVAVWEALRRSTKKLLEKLAHVARGRIKRAADPKEHHLLFRETDGLLEWIFYGAPIWEPFLPFPPELLPFAVRYSKDIRLVNSIVEFTGLRLSQNSAVMITLRSLILSAGYSDGPKSSCFSQLVMHLQVHLVREIIPDMLRPLVGVFVGATREEVLVATHTSPHSGLPSFDISVGQVLLRLITHSRPAPVDDVTWEVVLSDVIQFTPCCEFPFVLEELKLILRDENRLQGVLTSEDVLSAWRHRFSSEFRQNGENCENGGLSHILFFYFTVFGLNLQWMEVKNSKELTEDEWDLVKGLPVEIATALESNRFCAHLLPQFVQLLRAVHLEDINTGGGLLFYVSYRTDGEWEKLLRLLGEECGSLSWLWRYPGIPCWRAAPLIRAFIKIFGVKQAKEKVSYLWRCVPSCVVMDGDSPGVLGSVLHLAIELGELEEVERRDWPGLLTWRNSQGKNALDVAMEIWGHTHPITTHLQSRTLSKRYSQEMDLISL